MSDDAVTRVRALLEASAQVKRDLAQQAEGVAAAAALVGDAFRSGHKVLLFGNGGSAADAQHIAAEWCGRLSRERDPLPALALSANSSDLTALANDYGFEEVFARLVRAHANRGDVVIAISTSGNSPNVLRGVEAARAIGAHTVAWSGKGGGKLAAMVDRALVVPSDDTQRIQEAHITLGHIIAELVDDALFPEA
jgi:D-sedoheptulose 7-phosphate isomerase